jgi:hypothetical protein
MCKLCGGMKQRDGGGTRCRNPLSFYQRRGLPLKGTTVFLSISFASLALAYQAQAETIQLSCRWPDNSGGLELQISSDRVLEDGKPIQTQDLAISDKYIYFKGSGGRTGGVVTEYKIDRVNGGLTLTFLSRPDFSPMSANCTRTTSGGVRKF